jgi:hypothetical protein
MPRPRFQFGLATVFVTIALVALACWVAKKEEARQVAAVISVGAFIILLPPAYVYARNRRFQFRLRTLFVVMTAWAVACAVGIPLVRLWRNSRLLDVDFRTGPPVPVQLNPPSDANVPQNGGTD